MLICVGEIFWLWECCVNYSDAQMHSFNRWSCKVQHKACIWNHKACIWSLIFSPLKVMNLCPCWLLMSFAPLNTATFHQEIGSLWDFLWLKSYVETDVIFTLLQLDGRVKTLHPNIHGGILARRDQKHHMEALSEHGIGQLW